MTIRIPLDERLDKIEKHLFGETALEAVHKQAAAQSQQNTKFDKESAAMQGTTIHRLVICIGGIGFQCNKCMLTFKFNKEGKFEVHGVSDEQLIRLGRAPLEDRCDHKRDPKQPGQTQIFDYTKTLFPTDHYQKL